MGFFKRFFSLSSGRRKKDKRKQSTAHGGQLATDAEGRIVHPENRPNDSDATRLLRSASARWASTDAIQTLAPPPMPYLSVPASPAQSLQTLASSLKRSNTFTVQIHGRTLHSCTEFPNANPPIDGSTGPHTPRHGHGHDDPSSDDPSRPSKIPAMKTVIYTPRDENRLRALRRDPSVLSLLNMYDDHGRLDEHAFSNSPPNAAPIQEGREQTKRGGSTLRQLLGETVNGEATERDISWADRVIQEAKSATSSTSSLPLVTPDHQDDAFIPNPDEPSSSSSNYPAISSLEVEFSGTSYMLDPDQPIPIPFEDRPVAPKTPQHANQVFGFLSERRRSVRSRAESAFGLSTATLPQLDTASSSSRPSQPASEAGPPTPSFEESHWQTSVLHADIKTATLMKLSTAPAAICRQSTIASAPPSQTEFLGFPELQRARTGSSAHSALTHRSSIAQPSRIPRGPRARRSKQSLDRDFRRSQPDLPLDLQMQLHPDGVQDHATGSSAPGRRPSRPSGPRAEESSKSIDALATGPPRTYRRSTSRASTEAEAEERAPPVPPKPVSSRHQRGAHKRRSPRARPDEDKENSDISPQPSPALARSKSAALGGPSGGPVTPTRARSVFNTRHRPDLAHQPSPTSSSELSPLAKDMMANLRKQRLRVQHAARKSGRGMRAAS